MPYTYTGYHLRQTDYLSPCTTTEWLQPPIQTPDYVEWQHLQQPQVRPPTCWDATDRHVASFRPPAKPQPEPDPPYGIPNYSSSNFGLPSTTTNNSIGHQPYATFDGAAPPFGPFVPDTAQPVREFQPHHHSHPLASVNSHMSNLEVVRPSELPNSTIDQILDVITRLEMRLDVTTRCEDMLRAQPQPFEYQPYDQPSTGVVRGLLMKLKSLWTEHKTGCNCYPPPPAQATDSHQPAAVNVMPQQAAIPPPGSPDITEEEEVLLDVEEILHVANETQLDLDLPNVIAQKVEHDRLDSFLLQEDKDGFYVELHAGNVASTSHHLTTLDADARVIPSHNDTLCLSILGRVDKLSILALISYNHKRLSLVIFDGNKEGRRSSVRCAFDPGGDVSPKLMFVTQPLFVMLFVVSWFPP